MKSTNRLTRHFNAYKSHFYPKLLYKPLQHKSHNEKDVLGKNWENKGDLLCKTVTTITVNGILEISTEDTS